MADTICELVIGCWRLVACVGLFVGGQASCAISSSGDDDTDVQRHVAWRAYVRYRAISIARSRARRRMHRPV